MEGFQMTSRMCGKKDPDQTEEDCPNKTECPNCQENHSAFSRSCDIYKREREITEIKYMKNVSFVEARKTVDLYMKENTYTTLVRSPTQLATTKWISIKSS